MGYSLTSFESLGVSPSAGLASGFILALTPAMLGAVGVPMPPHVSQYPSRVEVVQVADISSVNPHLNKSIVLANTKIDRELQSLARGAYETLLARQSETEADIAAAMAKNRARMYVVL